MAYIYSITNNVNGKQYIGKTSKDNPYDRWKEHIQHSRHQENTVAYSSVHTMPIIRALKKYGSSNFKFRVIEECTADNIDEREKHYIEKYNTCDGVGYNCTYGGEGISKPPKYWSNHPHSRPVTCWSLDGNYICDYETTGVALVETLGRKPQKSERGCIKACCQGKTFQSHNYRWTWKGEPLKEWKDKQIRLRHKIYGYNQKGEYKEWESQSKCAEFIEGDIRNNNGVFQSIKSPRKNKLQCKGWYLFHKKGKIIPFDKITFASRGHSTDICKKAAEASAIKRRKPVRATSILTGETLTFKSISEASFYIKGQGNYAATGNISLNIKNRENGQHWKFAYNHKWDYC
tara:strand:- start:683 stop:1720 length:1038 start_codon:yes stop_codon:yes gene_type:complete